MKLRSHLVTLVVVATLPVLIFAAVMVVMFSREQITTQEKNLVNIAQAVSLDIDRELLAWIRALQALATSKYLDSADFKQFHEQAKRVLQTSNCWHNIILTDPSGQELVNLRLGYGSPLPRVGNLTPIKQVVETGRPAISDLFRGQVAKGPLLVAEVPVARAGKIKYVLASSTSPAFLPEILSHQQIPHGWIVTVLDKNRIIIARSQNHEKFFGQPATPRFAAKSREATAGSFEETTLDRVRVSTGFRRSALSGWTVEVAVPVTLLEAPVRRSLTNVTIGGVLLLLVGIALAIGFGQRIAKPIKALSVSAEALGRGEIPRSAPSPIAEIDQVARAIENAAIDRKDAEQSLQDSEERLRLAIIAADIGTWHWDLTGGEKWSEKCREIIGISPDAPVSSQVFLNAVHSDDRDRVRDAAIRARENKEYYDQEYRVVHADGSVHWVVGKGRSYYDVSGKLTCMEGVVLDVTERKQAEEQLRRNSRILEAQYAELHQLYRNMPVGLALMDRAFRFVRINDQLAEINGKPAAEHLGRTLREIVPGLAGEVESLYRRVLETGKPVLNVEIRGTTPAAPEVERDWLANFYPLQLEDGSIQGIGAMVQDITERKGVEQALQARYQELQWFQEISQAILKSENLQSTAATILDKALSISSCDLGIIRLLNRTTGMLESVASRGYRDPENLLRHHRFPKDLMTQELMRTFALIKKPVVVENVQDIAGLRTFKNENVRSLIMIPLMAGGEILGLFQVGSRTPRKFESNLVSLLETVGSNLGVAVQKSRLLEETLASQSQLRSLSRRLVEAQEIERRSIARELHDEIGQILTGLKFTLAIGPQSGENRADTKLEEALKMVDDLMGRVRELSLRFRPAMLDDLGLVPALLWYFQSYTAQTGVQVNFEHSGLESRVAPELETAAYRIIQEALTNVARHAAIKETRVSCQLNHGALRVEIQDRGIGFSANAIAPEAAGLSGMKERAASLGGALTIESAPGIGTQVIAEFPLSAGYKDFN
jgi:PAS domain S-box-containing protein